jgi:uncharacterized protein YcfL
MKKLFVLLVIALAVTSCSVLAPNSTIRVNGDSVETDAVAVSKHKKVRVKNENQTGQNFLYAFFSWLGLRN